MVATKARACAKPRSANGRFTAPTPTTVDPTNMASLQRLEPKITLAIHTSLHEVTFETPSSAQRIQPCDLALIVSLAMDCLHAEAKAVAA